MPFLHAIAGPGAIRCMHLLDFSISEPWHTFNALSHRKRLVDFDKAASGFHSLIALRAAAAEHMRAPRQAASRHGKPRH